MWLSERMKPSRIVMKPRLISPLTSPTNLELGWALTFASDFGLAASFGSFQPDSCCSASSTFTRFESIFASVSRSSADLSRFFPLRFTESFAGCMIPPQELTIASFGTSTTSSLSFYRNSMAACFSALRLLIRPASSFFFYYSSRKLTVSLLSGSTLRRTSTMSRIDEYVSWRANRY